MNALLPIPRPTADDLAATLDTRITALRNRDDDEAADALEALIPGRFDTYTQSLAWARENAERDLDDEWSGGLVAPQSWRGPAEWRDGAEAAVERAQDDAAWAWRRDVERVVVGERVGAGCVG